MRRVRTIREWDTLAIAPRYVYDGPEHYYRELSVVPRLDVRWIARAGHLGFASDVDLGQRCETGLEAQLACWFGDA